MAEVKREQIENTLEMMRLLNVATPDSVYVNRIDEEGGTISYQLQFRQTGKADTVLCSGDDEDNQRAKVDFELLASLWNNRRALIASRGLAHQEHLEIAMSLHSFEGAQADSDIQAISQAIADAEARGAAADQAEPSERWAVRVLDAWANVGTGRAHETKKRAASVGIDPALKEWACYLWSTDESGGSGVLTYEGQTPDLARISAARALCAEDPTLPKEPSHG